MSSGYENKYGGASRMSNDNSYQDESAFDEDVERFEAETYSERFGDRWKKLATSVRDVVQPDGSVVREYVIEDPSLLEQLSEGDENFDITQKSNATNRMISPVIEHQARKSIDNSMFNKIGQSLVNAQWQSNLSRANSSGSMGNIYENEGFYGKEGEKYFQPIISAKDSGLDEKSNGLIKDDDEFDKEVENIHQQGEQLKQMSMHNIDEGAAAESNKTFEYEIVDEHGNPIQINGAERLKELAASVKEIKQPDGSIVKEYTLNDPKIIEQIRNQMAKSNSNNFSLTNNSTNELPRKTMGELNLAAKTPINLPPPPPLVATPQTLINTSKSGHNLAKFEPQKGRLVQEQIQKFHTNFTPAKRPEQLKAFETQQQHQQPPVFKFNSETLKSVIPNFQPATPKQSQTKFEVKTSTGKVVELMMMSEEASETDIEEVQSLIKKGAQAINNHKTETKLANSEIPHLGTQSKTPINQSSPSRPISRSNNAYIHYLESKAQPSMQNYLNFAKSNQRKNSEHLTEVPINVFSDDTSTVSMMKRSSSSGNVTYIEPKETFSPTTLNAEFVSSKPKGFNSGTYTKSTMNLTYASSGSDLGALSEKSNKKELKMAKEQPGRTIYVTPSLNKSMNNLDERKFERSSSSSNNGDMAEHLLLKFLLHQIASNQKERKLSIGSYEASGFGSMSYSELSSMVGSSTLNSFARSNLMQKSATNLDSAEKKYTQARKVMRNQYKFNQNDDEEDDDEDERQYQYRKKPNDKFYLPKKH